MPVGIEHVQLAAVNDAVNLDMACAAAVQVAASECIHDRDVQAVAAFVHRVDQFGRFPDPRESGAAFASIVADRAVDFEAAPLIRAGRVGRIDRLLVIPRPRTHEDFGRNVAVQRRKLVGLVVIVFGQHF